MLNGYKLIIRGSCPYYNLVSVLVTSAIDIPEYLEHIEKSENNTFGFILVLIEYGAKLSVKHVYIQRGSILQNFIPDTESNKFELAMFSKKSKKSPVPLIRTIDVETNILKTWNFMMNREPSLKRIRNCECGFYEEENVPAVLTNDKILQKGSFKTLMEAIIIIPSIQKKCNSKNCGRSTQEKIQVNAHIFIEMDVRKDEDKNQSMPCKVTDFPVDVSLLDKNFRFVKLFIKNLDT